MLSGTPAYNDDFLSDGVNNLDATPTGTITGATYTTPAAVSETAANMDSFVPTKDPIKTISVYVSGKGTGNWTLTLHDSANTSLGTATITNASLTNAAYNDFTFATPVRVVIGNTYHFHVTSTVADGTIRTGTASDLSTGDWKEYFGILISDTAYHPIAQHTNGVAGTVIIGNREYIAEWTQGTYNPNKITLEPGYRVRYFVQENEFQVAMCWRGDNFDSYEDGKAFYWDGISNYYNYAKPITGGTPNASTNFKNRILSVLGSSGDLNIGTEPFRKLQPAPKLARGKKVEVLPGAMSTWQGKAHIGLGANTDDATGLEQGVYEFGNQSDRALSFQQVSTEVLNFGYSISTGTTQSTSMKIGFVGGWGKDLYVSWKDGSTYGVDKISKGNNPAATGTWESLIIDQSADSRGNAFSAPQKTKQAQKIVVTFVALPTGCTVTPKYKINRASSFTLATAEQIGTATQTRCELPIYKPYKEIEIGFDLVATTGYPTITSIEFFYDPLSGERDES